MADKDKEKEAPAEAAEGAEAAAAEPKKRSPIIFIVIGVVVALLLAAGISIFVTTQIVANATNGGGGGGDEGRHHDNGIFLKLGDPKEGILVNVGGPRGGKFLKAGIVLEMNPGRTSVINEETHTFLPDAEIKIIPQKLKTSQLKNKTNSKNNLKTRLTPNWALLPCTMFTLQVSCCNNFFR